MRGKAVDVSTNVHANSGMREFAFPEKILDVNGIT
jgi:hypothetical protein